MTVELSFWVVNVRAFTNLCSCLYCCYITWKLCTLYGLLVCVNQNAVLINILYKAQAQNSAEMELMTFNHTSKTTQAAKKDKFTA